MEEYRLDPIRFIEELLGISLNVGQKLLINTCFPVGVEPEDWPYKQINLLAANRWGKSVLIACLTIWMGTFKHRVGLAYGTAEWWDAKYNTVNICPLVDLAYVVREKVGEILADEAKEQIMRTGGRGHINPQLQMLFMKNSQSAGKNPFLVNIENTEYPGFRTQHNVSMEFRTTDEGAKALQGRKKYFVSYDEFTREKDPLTRLGSDITPRTLDTRGIIFCAGTPHLETASTAEQVWQQGNPENPDRVKSHMSFQRPIYDNPAITQEMIDELVESVPDYLRPQVLEGKFVQSGGAFFNSVKVDQAATNIPNLRRRTKGHTYICGWDLAVAKDGDRTIGIVVDVTSSPCRVIEYLELTRGTQHPEIVMEMVNQLKWYHDTKAGTNAFMVYDETGLAGKMFKAELSTVYPRPRGYDFTNKIRKKLDILHSLRILLAKNMLVYPKECTRLNFELKHYERKDNHLETDAVMSLALAVYMVERTTGRLQGQSIINDSLSA